MRNDTSLAKIGTALAWMRDCAWLFSRCHSARISAVANGSRRSKAKRRFRPGAMPQAICAASMAMVPDPQTGSCSAPPCSGVPRQSAAASIAAASVSLSGASPLSSRQPRLNSGSPELSTYNTARSSVRCSTSDRSGCCVSTLGRSPVASRMASHTASLMRKAAKFRLRKGLRCEVVSTRSVCCGVIHWVQSTVFASRYRSVSSRYAPSATSTSTRCASRHSRFSVIRCSGSPSRPTPPRDSCIATPGSRRCNSVASKDSTPAAQGRNSGSGMRRFRSSGKVDCRRPRVRLKITHCSARARPD